MKGYVSMELNTCFHCILNADQFGPQLVGQPYLGGINNFWETAPVVLTHSVREINRQSLCECRRCRRGGGTVWQRFLLATERTLQELGSFPICQRKNRDKWKNIHPQFRYRASAIPTIGTLTPVRDYSAPLHFQLVILYTQEAYL